ncbi:threonine ammonia-lyase, biosynthetic [Methylobacter sp. S3L5C]|uniref:threonine ammonia-lyase, biosynthetic n=1 Tax=Methylobacter sp. S3L5C TaxID=2839024 RepID=UPI001FAB45B5|nr:threonine ammonia-lyase, biosynthetic [Methylobacter sp. S3L5C]UOA09667.1 threonine ammonia-lyase, biosynthetic [Methylobacter sp. S3L5C]
MPPNYIEKILRAKVYDVAIETPLDFAPSLSERLVNRIFLKREDLQSVFSFKLRGAYNKISMLDEASRAKGVIAASAGNHAQGVALAAKKLAIKALIVMPTTTPEIKIKSVMAMGADIILFGDSYSETYTYALELSTQNGMVFIHPFDDPDIIAGQGTVAMEILRQHPGDLHAIFVPVGGGGLIAGIAVYVKFVRPDIKIIGVEPYDADCLNRALKANSRVIIDQVGLFADGVAVKQVGAEPFRLAQSFVDEVITVNTDEICAAIKDIFDDTRSIAEPAGALAIAGLKKYIEREQLTGQNLIAIDSGANINFDRLRYVAERAQVGEHREILLAVSIPEVPGSFLAFCKLLGGRSITEFNYRYFDASMARIFVGISSSGLESDRATVIGQLQQQGFQVTDMTANELAKEHSRYMVGGHAPPELNELVYSIQFSERPDALLKFLTQLGGRWNISLFHYRNHGAAFGKVLMGIQTSHAEQQAFQHCLDELDFTYSDETENPAYQLFFGGIK